MRSLLCLALVSMLAGCGHDERIEKLEEEVASLRASVSAKKEVVCKNVLGHASVKYGVPFYDWDESRALRFFNAYPAGGTLFPVVAPANRTNSGELTALLSPVSVPCKLTLDKTFFLGLGF